MEDMKCTS